ncbi:DNA polymerase III subunit delta [Peteryoungia desertarenae]|uniref:DNA polymerase III subunit delta n=1 Tax=Peteryoungia desertarenae TaxID=1813451 RepID=A0ABX6QKJ7_9HYPH|nr:DNA polymerase III subunit delta [Peteryoungia desertarenae]QLF68851.1 DNA polymerase III subunit delta [Peteryoungia desertarenae]
MVEIKSHEFDGFLQKSARHYRLFLVYGPDRGLVGERAAELSKQTTVDLSDSFAVTKLESSDLQSDPGRLVDEVNSLGLFGGERLVWVRNAANEKAVIEGLQILASDPPTGATVIIEAGDLKKGSALRKVAESERGIACIACYQDDVRALNALIDHELATERLRITPAARELLLESIGGDRIASRNEIRKLILYCHGHELIDETHVLEIIGDASTISTDSVVDAVLSGDADVLHHALQKVISSKTPVFLVLQSCLKQFQQLELMRSEMDDRRQQAGQIMQSLGRGIHFRRKPIVERALRNWTTPDLARESSRIHAAILQSRQRPQLEDNLAMQTLLAVTLQAARRNRG